MGLMPSALERARAYRIVGGIYIGAFCDTPSGPRAVINTNALADRHCFAGAPTPHDRDGESLADRLARRAANWTPACVHRPRAVASPAGVL